MFTEDWFHEKLRGDGLILRMKISASSVEAKAYSCYYDDAAPVGTQLTYRHDDSHDNGASSVDWMDLSLHPVAKWVEIVKREYTGWPYGWQSAEEIVCTATHLGSSRRISTANPQALVHLARFQAAVLLTQPEGFWGVSAGIISRRLEGVVKAGVRDWRRLID